MNDHEALTSLYLEYNSRSSVASMKNMEINSKGVDGFPYHPDFVGR